MEKRFKFSAWYVFLAARAVLIIDSFIVQTFQVTTIPTASF